MTLKKGTPMVPVRRTRASLNWQFEVPQIKTTTGQRCWSYLGPYCWNKLPEYIKTKNLIRLKIDTKNYLLLHERALVTEQIDIKNN